MIIMQFAAREPIFPPGRTIAYFKKIVALKELGARWDRIFKQKVFRLGTGDRQANGDRVAGSHRAAEWDQIVYDPIVLFCR